MIGNTMNKKNMILSISLILCSSTASLPNDNAILDTVYAADKAGDLACLADNKYTSTPLLAHLKKVKSSLQELIEYQQKGMQWFKELYLSDPQHHQDEIEGILLLNLCEDFYNNSEILQKKLSEFVTPMFDLICNNMAMVSDISVDMFQAYNESTLDTDTTTQLRASFESIYNQSEEIKSYCKNYPNSDVAQTTIDELFEDALDTIIYNDGMLTYEVKALLHKIDAKIAELEL